MNKYVQLITPLISTGGIDKQLDMKENLSFQKQLNETGTGTYLLV